MKQCFLLLLFAFFCITLSAQELRCGNDFIPLTEEEKAMALNFSKRTTPSWKKNNNIDSIPLTIHIIQANTAVDIGFILAIEQEIEKMNRAFTQVGIRFYTCGSARIIRGKENYERLEANVLNRIHHVPNTINVYYTDDVLINGQSRCGYAFFPFSIAPKERYIRMNKACSTNGSTLTHEMGHFYGLFHTHETYLGNELVNGSNCQEAGDLLCDTPADPNLSGNNLINNCIYVGRLSDANGDAYSPSPNNFMSYSPSGCRRFFSPEQSQKAAAIHEDLNSYLVAPCGDFPDLAISTNSSEITMPSNMNIDIEYTFDVSLLEQEEELLFKVILLDDEELSSGVVLHEESLLFTPDQNSFTQTYTLDFPNTKVTGTYYLQAILDTEYKVLEASKDNNQFTTLINVDNSELDDFLLQPNPVADELNVFLRTKSNVTGDLTLRIFSYDGRLIQEVKGYKSKDEYIRVLDVSDLQTGFYFVYIKLKDLRQDFVFKFVKL